MAFEIYDAANNDGLFDILGKLFQIIKQSNSYRATTLKTAGDNFIQTFQNKTDITDEFLLAARHAATGTDNERVRIGTEVTGAARAVIELLHEFVEADADQPARSIENSIDYLMQMAWGVPWRRAVPMLATWAFATHRQMRRGTSCSTSLQKPSR